MRGYHPIPVVDDIVPELNGSDLFSKLDLKDGYWHVKLSKESSYLTTFSTPFGKFRYTRLPFGLCVSQDVFQYKVDETYGPCEGAIGISDDITIHGKGDAHHDQRLHAAMEKTRKSNLCPNYEKLLIKQKVKFFRNIYSAEGVRADPKKVAAIADMRPPESKAEVKSFLGMVNYLQKFIPRLSEHTKLLRSLEKKGIHFTWGEEHQAAFERVKEMVTEDMLLAYYDRKKPVTLQCDYSKNGIGVSKKEGVCSLRAKRWLERRRITHLLKGKCLVSFTGSRNSITTCMGASLLVNVITSRCTISTLKICLSRSTPFAWYASSRWGLRLYVATSPRS